MEGLTFPNEIKKFVLEVVTFRMGKRVSHLLILCVLWKFG